MCGANELNTMYIYIGCAPQQTNFDNDKMLSRHTCQANACMPGTTANEKQITHLFTYYVRVVGDGKEQNEKKKKTKRMKRKQQRNGKKTQNES